MTELMAILRFKSALENKNINIGGKGKTLAFLSHKNLPVPDGIILTSPPEEELEWQEIFKWWQDLGAPKLAIRSSALGEDSEEFSFAGQNLSFLNVSSREEIKAKVLKCFESLKREASTAYQKHFLAEDQKISMNVVLQEMIDPLFSGVYFSKDPRGLNNEEGDLFEVVHGLGEALVSGKVTPYLFSSHKEAEEKPDKWEESFTFKVKENGKKVRDVLDYDLDMEWAIDKSGDFYVLQARPITSMGAQSLKKKYIDYEVARLKKTYSNDVVWDGKTFAEWGGFPSYVTFSIWKDVFSPHFAFGKALKKLGYLSFVDKPYSPKDSVLERVFGRAYINLEKVGSLYYGDIPFRMKGRPKPRLVFDWSMITFLKILRAPAAIWRMVKVGFSLSTQRRKWIEKGRQELLSFRTQLQRSKKFTSYNEWTTEEIFERLERECNSFSKETLIFPLILVILSESTMRSLFEILKGFYGDSKIANNKIREWLSHGLRTQTYQMNLDFKKACQDEKLRERFLHLYGHRGPGELDLVNPRWAELGNEAFISSKPFSLKEKEEKDLKVEDEIKAFKTLKKEVILQEWHLLKDLLELREQWKMEMLKPYAQIRYLLTELGERLELGKDVHWLRLSEIYKVARKEISVESLSSKISERKQRFYVFKKTSFPEVISLSEIESIAEGRVPDDFKALEGEALSSGMVLGTVRVVEDPSTVNLADWPEDAILVAEAVDPGWTPLFVNVKGVVIEKGGVLSHCAILARELEIPAVSGIYQCSKRLNDGDRIWVDGYNGVVSYEH